MRDTRKAATLAVVTAAAALAIATAAWAQDASPPAPTGDYVIAPLPATDSRSNFLPPQGAVYVIDRAAGTVTLCYPTSKDGTWIVQCTGAVKLPKAG